MRYTQIRNCDLYVSKCVRWVKLAIWKACVADLTIRSLPKDDKAKARGPKLLVWKAVQDSNGRLIELKLALRLDVWPDPAEQDYD